MGMVEEKEKITDQRIIEAAKELNETTDGFVLRYFTCYEDFVQAVHWRKGLKKYNRIEDALNDVAKEVLYDSLK